MKLNEAEVQMFKSLQSSELGKTLFSYLERLESDICDVRNWKAGETADSARQAARAISELRTRLSTQMGKQSNPSEYV